MHLVFIHIYSILMKSVKHNGMNSERTELNDIVPPNLHEIIGKKLIFKHDLC